LLTQNASLAKKKSVKVSTLPVYWSELFGTNVCKRGRNSGKNVDIFLSVRAVQEYSPQNQPVAK